MSLDADPYKTAHVSDVLNDHHASAGCSKHPAAQTRCSRLDVPATSYWETLREADRIGSINAHTYRKLGRKTGWLPAGVVLERWTEEISPTITKIINDAGNYERIFGKQNKRSLV
jgi:hypothetical protein